MADVDTSLTELMTITGALGCCIVDYRTGAMLGQQGGGVDLAEAAAGNSEVVKAKLATLQRLGKDSHIEDILITITDQFHVIRPVERHTGLFIYLVLSRVKGNLALARRKVLSVEAALIV